MAAFHHANLYGLPPACVLNDHLGLCQPAHDSIYQQQIAETLKLLFWKRTHKRRAQINTNIYTFSNFMTKCIGFFYLLAMSWV